jgi:hypothetical protein
MDTIKDLLGKYRPSEPPEVKLLKDYISERFDAASKISLQGENVIVITVHSASLANTLRYHIPQLQAAAATTKKLVLRIA